MEGLQLEWGMDSIWGRRVLNNWRKMEKMQKNGEKMEKEMTMEDGIWGRSVLKGSSGADQPAAALKDDHLWGVEKRGRGVQLSERQLMDVLSGVLGRRGVQPAGGIGAEGVVASGAG